MHDIKKIEKDFNCFTEALHRRGSASASSSIAELLRERKICINNYEAKKAEQNKASKEIGELAKAGKSDEVLERAAELSDLKDEIKILEDKRKHVESDLEDYLMRVPNNPHDSVPDGYSERENVPFEWSTPDEWKDSGMLSWKRKSFEHIVGDCIKYKKASVMSGFGFSILTGELALLERAIIELMLDWHRGCHKYHEVSVPSIVRKKALEGTGQLPKFQDDLFKIDNEDLYLIPTGEVPLTNIHANEVIQGELPKYVTCTPCFRREAGGYGLDSGLFRQHEFKKVELVRFEKPGNSFNALEEIKNEAKKILELLDLKFRVVELCAGDLGFSACKTFDLEVYLPSQNKYREISSCSLFGDFQARRAKIRYKEESGSKPKFVHTLNASGLAVGRTLIAIVEQHQQEDGSVKVPDLLIPYTHNRKFLFKKDKD
jgi:seryl-tRNA synthetase